MEHQQYLLVIIMNAYRTKIGNDGTLFVLKENISKIITKCIKSFLKKA